MLVVELQELQEQEQMFLAMVKLMAEHKQDREQIRL